MQYVVSYSGGIGSFCAAHRLKQAVDPSNITLLFCDTLIEDEDLYRFLNESAQKLNLPLVKIADGRTPWEVFRDKKYQGNTRTAHCSQVLKTELARKWINKNMPDATLVLGIGWEEQERLGRAQKNWSIPVIAPLCEKPWLGPQDMREIVKSYGIEIPRLYALGFPHNNCGGFCVRAGLKQFAALKKHFPERFEHHRQEQEKLMKVVPNVKPFLRKTVDGKINYLTLAEFADMTEVDNGEPQLQWGGCGCFIDTEEQ